MMILATINLILLEYEVVVVGEYEAGKPLPRMSLGLANRCQTLPPTRKITNEKMGDSLHNLSSDVNVANVFLELIRAKNHMYV